MSEILIIAEKPSVAATIAAALGAKEKKDGYIAGNGCLKAERGGDDSRRAGRKREKGRVYRRKRLPCFLVRGAFGTACGSCRLWRAVQEMGL